MRGEVNIEEYQLDSDVYAKSWKTGSGRWILLLHEALGCTEMWGDFPQQLAEQTGKNVISFDRSGHGKSRANRRKRDYIYHWIEGAIRVPKVLGQLNIKQVEVMGLNDGGSLALCFAAAYHRRIKKMVTVGAPITANPVMLAALQEFFHHPDRPKIIAGMEKYHGDKAQPLFERHCDFWDNKAFQATFDLKPLLATIQAPCLALQGENHLYGDQTQIFALQKAIGDHCRAELIPDMNFLPHRSNPKALLARCVSFFGKE